MPGLPWMNGRCRTAWRPGFSELIKTALKRTCSTGSFRRKLLPLCRKTVFSFRPDFRTKAKKAGFDWDSVDGAYDALDSEIKELKAAQQSGDPAQIENELGDVLFSVVNVSRFLHVDPEQALTGASNKFLNRYLEVEKLASARGIDMPGTPIEELDKLWAEAKDKLESN